MNARSIMTPKVITAREDMSLRACMTLLTEHRISGLPVIRDGELVGIITEGDIVEHLRRKVPWYAFMALGSGFPYEEPPESFEDLASQLQELSVKELMTRRVITVPSYADLPEVARMMTEWHIKRLPVVDHGRMVGIISRGDVIKSMVKQPPDQEASES